MSIIFGRFLCAECLRFSWSVLLGDIFCARCYRAVLLRLRQIERWPDEDEEEESREPRSKREYGASRGTG